MYLLTKIWNLGRGKFIDLLLNHSKFGITSKTLILKYIAANLELRKRLRIGILVCSPFTYK